MDGIADALTKIYRFTPGGIVQGIVEKQVDVLAGKDTAANIQKEALQTSGEYVADIPKKIASGAAAGVNKLLWVIGGVIVAALLILVIFRGKQ